MRSIWFQGKLYMPIFYLCAKVKLSLAFRYNQAGTSCPSVIPVFLKFKESSIARESVILLLSDS
jgi:hypothetical protein